MNWLTGQEEFLTGDNIVKVHKVTLYVVDFDEVGAKGVAQVLEDTKYPNRCIDPRVLEVDTAELGEWDDSSPLNMVDISVVKAELDRLFSKVD